MNCPKCIIDGGKVRAAGVHLKESAEVQLRTIEELYDPQKSPVPLTDDEKAAIIAMSQEQCDLADVINDKIRQWDDTLCTIAVAHSHGGEHHTPKPVG